MNEKRNSSSFTFSLRTLCSLCLCVEMLLFGAAASAGDAPSVYRTIQANTPVKLPDGAAGAAWGLFIKNDFAGAEAAFKKALEADPKSLDALEGLRGTYLALGDYKNMQATNIKMVEASSQDSLCSILVQRTMDALTLTESHATVLEALKKIAANAPQRNAVVLNDQISWLSMRLNHFEEGRRLQQGKGYVTQWQFVAGPFGAKDRSNAIDRRFAPERALTTLDFTSEGEKAQTVKDVSITDRDLNISQLIREPGGIFYAFTNIESDSDQDVLLLVSTQSSYRAYLRGMPVISEPDVDQPFRRNGGDLVRTRLAKGSNPLLVKLFGAGAVTLRVFGGDYAPAEFKYKPLSEQQLAAHEVSTARGILFGQRVFGSTTQYFLKKYTISAETDREAVKKLAEEGPLTLCDAIWFEIGLQRENDLRSREVLARRLLATCPESVGMLDTIANILSSVGTAANNSEARHIEEARRLREKALKILPTSHPHSVAMIEFFNRRRLQDQAFEKAKEFAAAHPNSALAQVELSTMYEGKEMPIEAEESLEKAAQLDPVYTSRLASFHERRGNNVRARELRKKQEAAGLLDLASQFDQALSSGDFANAEKILALEEKWIPEAKDEWTATRARLLTAKGDLAGAYALLKKDYDSRPRRARDKFALNALVDLALRAEKDEDALALLRAFLKEHPGDFDLRNRLRSLENSRDRKWWDAYDVKSDQIDSSRFDSKNYPTSNHAWLADLMVTKILPDLSRESYVHISKKVLNISGIQELSEALVNAQQKDVVFVRTINPDGSVFQPENVHDFNFSQTASLYKVGPGSILEHAYLEHADASEEEPSFEMSFTFNAVEAPRAISRWVLMIPDEVKTKIDIRKIRPELIDEKILPGPPGYTVLQWSNRQVEGFKREPLMPAENDGEIIPAVTVESRARPFRATGLLSMQEREMIPDEAVAEAKRIAGARNDDKEKFDAILKWVRTTFQYGSDSRTLDDVWFSRSGNSTQLSLLAREMSQAAGLKVHSVAVNNSYNPARKWRAKNMKREWEPGELAGFGAAGRLLLLEPSFGPDVLAQFGGERAKYYPLYDVRGFDPSSLVLVSGDTGLRMRRLGGDAFGAPSHNVTIELERDGSATVKGALELSGVGAGANRERYADPQWNKRVRETLGRGFWPKLEAGEVNFKGIDDPDGPLSISYSGKVKSFASAANDSQFIQPFPQAYPGRPRMLELQGTAEREFDMLFRGETVEFDTALTYVAPEGAAWTEVPDDVFIATEFGFYFEDYNVRGRTMTCSRGYLMPQQRVTPEKYPALQKFINQIANLPQRAAYAPLKTESFGKFRTEVRSRGYATNAEKAEEAKADVKK